MRVKVLQEFRDKFNPSRIYAAGTYAEFDDEARVADLVARGLAEKEPVETPKAEPVKEASKAAPKEDKPKKRK